ncbi:nucleotidyltransferase domain-containing protein [Agrobacterium sp. NPDC089420]|uniref:nucleotidyltransferase domain-containing protein n=1 Tax=Agrobacterium sp. NPDC089420 TaxID=3363918 RepID=UPI00384F5688
MENTREKVATVIAKLGSSGIICDLFGGWAEEVLGLREPSAHRDIDMLYRNETFEELDSKLRDIPEFEEVPLKRFRHKRAFRFHGTLCEITLVQDGEGPFTLFWGDVPFRWDTPLLHEDLMEVGGRAITVVSADNIKRYRDLHKETQPHRWRDPLTLEPST